ncbi:MAG: ABC transporter permease [Christensenellaceae bacterium]|jgi:multidrug/hemolysin transport system permease protein|nr:ABC transporter permease [Christensenellaceae bacterium]
MKNIFAFTIRNIKLFLRDRMTVFFSIMSSLILILLYFLFIAKLYITGINATTVVISENAAGFLVYLQMMTGVLVLNSISLSLGMFSGMAKDFESRRICSFLLTPIKKREIILSYFSGGIIVSLILNICTWIVTVLLIGIITNYFVAASAFFLGIVVLIVSSLISSSIMMLLTVLVKSSTGLAIFNGVSGTFLGFICGIYMPYISLGKAVEGIGSFFPFTHLTAWFKNIVITDALSQIGVPSESKDILMNDWFSANGVGFCGTDAPLWLMLLLSGIIGLACLYISGLLLKKRIK